MVRAYETVYILVPELGEEEIRQTGERLQKVITDHGGRINAVDVWGRRRLAYEIADRREGFYTIINFEAEPSVPRELERVLNLNESVLRFLVFRVDADELAAEDADAADAAVEAPTTTAAAAEAVEAGVVEGTGAEPNLAAEPAEGNQ